MRELLKQTGGDLREAARMAAKELEHLKSRSDSISASIANMRQQAAKVRDIRDPELASAIKTHDPFQRDVWMGARQGIGSVDAVTQRAAVSTTRLQNAMIGLSVAATGIPGPVGRITSALSGMALGGGGVMIGVLAGVAALAYAWDRFTESGRRARDMMREIHAMETSFGPRAMAARAGSLGEQEKTATTRLDAMQQMRGKIGGPAGILVDLWNTYESGKLQDAVDEIRQRRAELEKLIADFTRQLATEASDAKRFATQTSYVAGLERKAGMAQAAAPWDQHAGIEEAAFAARGRAKLNFSTAAAKANREYSGEALVYKLAILRAEERINLTAAEGSRIDAHRLVEVRQLANAKMQLAQFAATRLSAEMGGVASSAISGGMSGGPAGAVAGFIMGLTDQILGAGEAARRAGEQLQQMRRQLQAFTDTLRLALGDITESQAQINALRRSTDEALAAAGYTREQVEAIRDKFPGHDWETDPKGDVGPLVELLELERRRIEMLKLEADAIDSMTEAAERFRNVPSWFKVNLEVWRAANEQPTATAGDPRGARRPDRGRGGQTSDAPLIDIRSIVINTRATNGRQLLEEFIAELRRQGLATFGAGEEARILANL